MSDSEEPSEQPPVPLWQMWDDYESEWIDEGKLRARGEAMEARLRARLVELNYLRLCGFCGFEILSYLFYSSSSTIYFYQKTGQLLLEPRGCCPMRGGRAGTPVCRYYLEKDSDHLSKIQVMKAKVEESISQLARYKEMLNFMIKI